MLTLDSGSHTDKGWSRRTFLKAGTLAWGGLTLGDLLKSRAVAANGQSRQKSVIMIHLSGGPSHLDMYDMKPQSPREYRGEFSPIATNVPGFELCELMPKQATIADRFTILRGAQIANLHTGNMFYSGFPWQETPRASIPGEAKRPALGSVVSKLRPGSGDIPAYVSVENHFEWERSYYLGSEHEPFRFGGGTPREAIDNFGRHRELTEIRLEDRRSLLSDLDGIRREVEFGEIALGVDQFQRRALEMVTSSRARDAFDLEREPKEVRTRYEVGTYRHGPHPGRSLLLARRLIEAGVSVVTVCVHGWDTHASNFTSLQNMLPALDHAIYALVTDLVDRGLYEDTAIVMGGEFGRTPRIGDLTPDGRGHWPDAGFLWLGGGGLKTGQTIGATDDRGETIIGKPIGMKNVLATVYKVLGIDPSLTFNDHRGRPQMILDEHEPVAGLL